MAQKYVTNFDVGTENIIIRDSNVMHGEGLINVKFPPDPLSPLKGDGSNETTVLQNMINYAISENMALFFPEGVYAVDSINVTGKATFIGSNAIIRKIVSSATPVINATGFLTMRGISVDGNISVMTAAVVGMNVENTGFDIADCSFTGCSDCIHADINTPSKLYNCKCETFNEYGIYLNGTSYINAFGISMNVQSNTAMRFMKLDNSNNVIYGLESMSKVPIGIEITGDFNYISARIPNCETLVDDKGAGSTWTMIGKDEKLYLERDYKVSSNELILNPTNPLTYRTPTSGELYNTIPFKDTSDMQYNVVVEKYPSLFSEFVCPEQYGAVGDGITNDTEAVQNAFNSGKPVIFLHDYAVTSVTYGVTNPEISVGGYDSVINFNGHKLIGISSSASDEYVLNITGARYNSFYNIWIDAQFKDSYIGCMHINSLANSQSQYNTFYGIYLQNSIYGLVWGESSGTESVENAQSETYIFGFKNRCQLYPFYGNQKNGYLTFVGSNFDTGEYEWSSHTSAKYNADNAIAVTNVVGEVQINDSGIDCTGNPNQKGFSGSDIYLNNIIMECAGTQGVVAGNVYLNNIINGYIGSVEFPIFTIENNATGTLTINNSYFWFPDVAASFASQYFVFSNGNPDFKVFISNTTFNNDRIRDDVLRFTDANVLNFSLPTNNVILNSIDDLCGLYSIPETTTSLTGLMDVSSASLSLGKVFGNLYGVTGSINAGGYARTHLIPIIEGDYYFYNVCGTGTNCYAFIKYYDKNKQQVGAAVTLHAFSNAPTNSSSFLLPPAGARYVLIELSPVSGEASVNATKIKISGRLGTPEKMTSESMPESGNYSVGDIVYNSNPSSGNALGWVCTSAPATFTSIGNVQ